METMGEFWKSIGPGVTAALLALVPVVAGAIRAWLQSRQHRWEAEAAQAHTEANELGQSFAGNVASETVDAWAVATLRANNPKLTEEKARALIQQAREASTPDRTTLPGIEPPRGS
jgi:hypothetical protein